MNYRHYRIFKYISFMFSHYISVINFNNILSFSVFSPFDYMSLGCIIGLN